MAEVGSIIDNKYRIIDQVGKGGMSVVYLARDKRLEKLWAVKEIRNVEDPRKRKTIIDSLKSEARLMKDLDHPAVVRIVDIIDEQASLFVVMDYIDGSDLTSYLYPNGKRNAPVALEEAKAVEWGIQICDVIRYLHSQNPPIIYYDLKPDNVMIRNEGDVRLIDFGAARRFNPDPEKMNRKKILGTVGYAAPEQYKGGGATDIRTDIYTFGVTLHFMVTGQPPQATKENKNPRIRPIRSINPRLSSGLERIINKCTQPNPEDRYQNCDELLYALEHYHELDDQYKAKQKKTLKTFVIAAAVSLGLLLVSLGFALANTFVSNNNYDNLVNASGDTDQQIESAYEAIDVDNSKTGAYDKILTLYESKGEITEDQANRLDAAINNSKSSMSESDDDYLDLRYRIGCDYLFYLVDNKGEYSLQNSVLRAYEHLSAVQGHESYENYDKANALYNFCVIYQTYVASSNTVTEADQATYNKMLESINTATDILGEAQGVESGTDGYTKLQFYSGLLGVVGKKVSGMVQTGVDKSKILDTIEKIKTKVNGVAVTVEKSSKLKESTLVYADTIKAQVSAAYGTSK